MHSLKPLWVPPKHQIEQSNLWRYTKWLRENKGLNFVDYEELHTWSCQHVDEFWRTISDFFEVEHHTPYKQVLLQNVMPGAQWFEGSTLNYSEHLFRHESKDRYALIFCHESGLIQNISWALLRQRVSAVQRQLVSLGIKKGDRVAAIIPNIPDAMISFMAVNALGAIWSCCSPDFGADTIYDRFSQIEPNLLITVDGYWYNRKSYSIHETSARLQSQIPSIKDTILIPYLNKESRQKDNHVLAESDGISEIHFEPVPFSHPIWILYSSGTTGKPKAITHSHGGVLLEHLKYLSLHNDVKPGENFFWFSTTGWMMWNFLQASLLVGATPVLYDGSPANPDLNILWKLAEQLPIHHFGTSAPYLTTLMKNGIAPGTNYNLSNLRTVGSTGSPLPPEIFRWVYEAISDQVWLCSMSGGTDVCTAFVGGCISKPVYEGRIQARGLGCALKAYDEEGQPVTGDLGEMVIEQPMPSMPIYFWNDTDNKRYGASYFEDFPGKWRHGDWIKIFEDGSLVIEGRSDATLNRKGIRIGTAEIYNAMDQLSEIKDSLIINIEKPNGEDVMPLFVSLGVEKVLTEELKSKINAHLKSNCSPRHVPDIIIQVLDIPYTLSGKKMEVPVKRLFTKHAPSKTMDYGAMRNPEAMKDFSRMAINKVF